MDRITVEQIKLIRHIICFITAGVILFWIFFLSYYIAKEAGTKKSNSIIKYFYWFARIRFASYRAWRFHFPIRFYQDSGHYFDMIFPFCIVALILFIIYDILIRLYYDILHFSMQIMNLKRAGKNG